MSYFKEADYFLHHDNARSHFVIIIPDYLTKFNQKGVPHPIVIKI